MKLIISETQLNEVINILSENGFNRSKYLNWKRKNVTLRGINEIGSENGGMAAIGRGLYTASLSNRHLAKQYGDVYFVLNAIPKHPKVFNTLNDWEIWFYNNLVMQYSREQGKEFPDLRDFYNKTTIEGEMNKLGFDGVIIKGREIVYYTPDMDKVQYFSNERQLENYYEFLVSSGSITEAYSEDPYLKDNDIYDYEPNQSEIDSFNKIDKQPYHDFKGFDVKKDPNKIDPNINFNKPIKFKREAPPSGKKYTGKAIIVCTYPGGKQEVVKNSYGDSAIVNDKLRKIKSNNTNDAYLYSIKYETL